MVTEEGLDPAQSCVSDSTGVQFQDQFQDQFITDHSKAVALMLFSVACSLLPVLGVSVTFHLMFVHYTFIRFGLLSDHIL